MCDFTMKVEQTVDYPMRMVYDPETDLFRESNYSSLIHQRGCPFPYGWLKETGTPPKPHFDVFLVERTVYDLGEELKVRVIGVFKRNDGDHKFVAVHSDAPILTYEALNRFDKEDLEKVYPHIGENEGWYGREVALELLMTER